MLHVSVYKAIIKQYVLTNIFEIKMDFGERGWDGVDWMNLGQDKDHWRALVNTVMKLRVP
jgi:hypothetical protein